MNTGLIFKLSDILKFKIDCDIILPVTKKKNFYRNKESEYM